MSLARKGAGVFLIHWVAVGVTFINQVLCARWLGADGMGAFWILGSAVILMTAVGGLGLPGVAVYLVRKEIQTDRSLLVHSSILAAAVTLAAGGALALFRGAFLGTFFPGMAVGDGLLGLALLSLPFSLILTFSGNLLLGRGRAGAYAWLTAGMLLAEFLGILILVGGFRLGLAGAMATFAGSRILFTIITVGVVLRVTRGQACSLRAGDLGCLLKLGLQHYLASLGPQAFMRLDNLILGYFTDARTVGLFSVPAAFYLVIQTMPRAVSALLTGRASEADEGEAAFVVCRASRVMLWVMVLAGLLMGAVAPWLIPCFFGASFAESVNPLPYLLGAGVLVGFTTSLQTYFLSVGRPGVNGVLTLAAGIVNVGLNVALIPPLGMLGSALATLASAILGAAFHAVLFRRISSTSYSSMVWPTREDLAALRERFLGRSGRNEA